MGKGCGGGGILPPCPGEETRIKMKSMRASGGGGCSQAGQAGGRGASRRISSWVTGWGKRRFGEREKHDSGEYVFAAVRAARKTQLRIKQSKDNALEGVRLCSRCRGSSCQLLTG